MISTPHSSQAEMMMMRKQGIKAHSSLHGVDPCLDGIEQEYEELVMMMMMMVVKVTPSHPLLPPLPY